MAKQQKQDDKPLEETEVKKEETLTETEGGHDYISRIHKTKDDGEVKTEEKK